jgi:hypothetical protein
MVIPLYGSLVMQSPHEKKSQDKKEEKEPLPIPQLAQAGPTYGARTQKMPQPYDIDPVYGSMPISPPQNDQNVQNINNKNESPAQKRNRLGVISTPSGRRPLVPSYMVALRNKVKREYKNKNQPHNTQDMSWLERVNVQDGSELIVNGVKYAPTT